MAAASMNGVATGVSFTYGIADVIIHDDNGLQIPSRLLQTRTEIIIGG